MKKAMFIVLVFVACLFSPDSASAKPCRNIFYSALPQHKGIVTVENVCRDEFPQIRQLVSASFKDANYEDLSTFAEKLTSKLGPKYRVSVFTVDEYLALQAEGKQPGGPQSDRKE